MTPAENEPRREVVELGLKAKPSFSREVLVVDDAPAIRDLTRMILGTEVFQWQPRKTGRKRFDCQPTTRPTSYYWT
jgi:PleD family two-component response regulator